MNFSYEAARRLRVAIVPAAVLVLILGGVSAVEAASKDDAVMTIKARAVSTINVSRASNDLIDIKINRWSSEAERSAGVKALVTQGSAALAEVLSGSEETGWVRFDPRGGGGPGRDPRKTSLRFSREIDHGDSKEITLLTNHFIGFGPDAQARDGSKLKEYPLSVVMLTLEKDDKGEWKGSGRIFVGTKIRFDSVAGKFIVDEFPNDPVFLKNVVVK